MRRIIGSALLLLLPLGCAVHVSEGGSGDQPDKLDEASKPNGSGVTEPQAEGESPARAGAAELPDCPADADVDTYCTADGKLAGRWVPVDTLRPPTSAVILFEAHPEMEAQPSLTILLDGETLYIKWVTCGSCRRVLGHGFSGVPAALSDEQLRALQTKLEFAVDSPLLDSADAWRSYVGGEPGQVALTELSTHASR